MDGWKIEMNLDMCSDIEIFHMVFNGELLKYPIGFWIQPDGIVHANNILKNLIENILKWDENDIIQNYDVNIFRKYRINGMLSEVFNSSPFEALNSIYPNKFKIWQFKVPNNYWKNEKNVKDAIRWLFEERLDIDTNDIIRISREDFYDNGLKSLVIFSDVNRIGIKNLIKSVYKNCEIKFKKRNYSK